MQIEFLRKFEKDLEKIDSQDVADRVLDLIQIVENAQTLADIPNLKKLKGYANAFRVRIGDYRLGLFLANDDTVEFVRFLHRKDIYKVFP